MKRIISTLLSICIAASFIPAAIAEESPLVWDAIRMTELSDTETENGVIYLGLNSARCEEHGKYIMTVFRDGNSENEASVNISTIDISAAIGEDYDIHLDNVEYYDNGGTVMERNADIDPLDTIEEFTDSVNEVQTELSQKSSVSAAESGSSLARIKEERTGQKTRSLSAASDTTREDFINEIIETYGDDALTPEEYQANSEKLLENTGNNIADYMAVSSTAQLIFAPGETEKQVEIEVYSDKKPEDDEIFMLMVSAPEGAELGNPNTATITIADDEEKEEVFVSFKSEEQTLTNGEPIIIERTGADYYMASVDVVLENGDSQTVYFKPYQTEAKIEMNIEGSGTQTVTLDNYLACAPGAITACDVTFGNDTAEISGSQVSGKIGLFASSTENKSFHLDNTNGGVSASSSSYKLRVDYVPGQTDENGKLYGKIMDESYIPEVWVGNYYFPSAFDRNISEGDQKYRHISEHKNGGGDVGENNPDGYLHLEYYDWRTWKKGKIGAKLNNINHELYGYYAADWLNSPRLNISPGSANGLMRIYNSSGNVTNKIYKGNKFDRTTTALVTLKDAGNNNKLPQTTKGFVNIYASDEEKNKTPDPTIHLFGLAAMFRKFRIALQQPGDMEFKDGTKTVMKKPCNVSLGMGHEVRYTNQTLAITGKSAEESTGLMPGELIGYKIETNFLSSSEDKLGFFYYMAKGHAPSEANSAEITDNTNDNTVYTTNDLTNIKFDGEFISTVDKYLKGVTGSNTGWTTDLRFTPLYIYKNIDVRIEANDFGSFNGYGPGEYYNGQFHEGDTLYLSGKSAEGYKMKYSGAKVVGRVTRNMNEEIVLNCTLNTGNTATEVVYTLGATLGGVKGCGFYTITPQFTPDEPNYISIDTIGNGGMISVGNVLSKEQIKTLMSEYPEYGFDSKSLIYICDPDATGTNEANKIVKMITPVPGKIYRLDTCGYDQMIEVRKDKDGNTVTDISDTYWAPVYENKYTYGTKKIGGSTAYITAADNAKDNIVTLSAVQVNRKDDIYLQTTGTLTTNEHSVRESAEFMDTTAVQGMTVYGPGEVNCRMIKDPSGANLEVSYNNNPSDTTAEDGTFSIAGIALSGKDKAYTLYYTNGDVEGISIVDVNKNKPAKMKFYRSKVNYDGTNSDVEVTVDGYISELDEDITTPLITVGAPFPVSLEYKFDSSDSTARYGTMSNSVPIVSDDYFTVIATINPNGREVKQVVFTVDKQKSADIRYPIDLNKGQTKVEYNFGGKGMQDLFDPGDKLFISLVDAEDRVVKYPVLDGDGNPVMDSAGNPSYSSQSYPIEYAKHYTGLSFYIPMVDAPRHIYNIAQDFKLDSPLIGSTMGNANSGVMTFNKNNWSIDGIDGYSLIFDINANVYGEPSPSAQANFNEIKNARNAASQRALQGNARRDWGAYDSAYKNSLTNTFGKCDINLNVIVLLKFDYAFNKNTGKYVFIGGQVAIGGVFDVSRTWYTVVYGVPLFLNAGLNVAVEVQANYHKVETLTSDSFSYYENIVDAMPEDDDVGLLIDMTGKFQAGVGICGVLSARGIIQILFKGFVPLKKDVTGGVLVGLQGGIGIDLLVFSFEYIADIGKIGTGIYKDQSGWGGSPNSLSADSSASLFDEGTMRVYNTGSGGRVKDTGDVELMQVLSHKVLLEDAPERARPQIVTLKDGRKFMVYIGSEEGRDLDVNKACLYYSVYENGAWSEAQPIEDDGTPDSTPSLALYGDDVIIAWADASDASDDSDDGADVLSSFDISVAVFDGNSVSLLEKFANSDKDAYGEEYMDYNPVICADPNGEKGAVLYYVKRDLGTVSTANDLVNPNGAYQTMAMTIWDGSGVEEERFVTIDGDPLIMEIDAEMIDLPVGDSTHTFAVCAYMADKDDDLTTHEDNDVYLLLYDITDDKTYDPVNLSNNYVPDIKPQLTRIDTEDGEEIYYTWLTQRRYNNDIITEFNMIPLGSIIESMAAENGDTADQLTSTEIELPVHTVNLSDDRNAEPSFKEYKIFADGDDNIYLLWTDSGSDDSDDFSTELYGAVHYAGDEDAVNGWSGIVKLTDFKSEMPNSVIDEYTATVGADGDFTLLSNMFTQNLEETTNKDGNPVYRTVYSPNSLIEFAIDDSAMAEINADSVKFADEYPSAGEETEIEFELENNGLMMINGYEAVVSVGGQEFGRAEIISKLFGGKSEIVRVSGVMPDNITADMPFEITVTNPDTEACTYSGIVPYGAHLEFETVEIEPDGNENLVYTVDITNTGNAASGDFTLDIRHVVNGDGLVGEVTRIDASSIASGDTVTKTVTLKNETLNILDFGSLGIAELNLRALSGETEIGNEIENVSDYDFAHDILINGSQAPINIAIGEIKMLNAQKIPEQSTDEFIYEIADPDIADVDEHGRIHGIKEGETKLTVKEVNSGISYTFDVEVKNGFSVEYIDGEAFITAPAEGTYSVIFATYDKDGTLEGVEIKEVTFDTCGVMTVSPDDIDVKKADKAKVMLWDDVNGMKPLSAPAEIPRG